jgi:hypothetical protein
VKQPSFFVHAAIDAHTPANAMCRWRLLAPSSQASAAQTAAATENIATGTSATCPMAVCTKESAPITSSAATIPSAHPAAQ